MTDNSPNGWFPVPIAGPPGNLYPAFRGCGDFSRRPHPQPHPEQAHRVDAPARGASTGKPECLEIPEGSIDKLKIRTRIDSWRHRRGTPVARTEVESL